MSWSNWAGDQVCHPARQLEPASLDELLSGLEHAPGPVRVAGAGHSFSDAVLTDGTLVSLKRMNQVLGVDAEAGRVRVEAGISINALSAALAEQGLALENLGDVDVQAIAGAAATATHGTGVRFANVSAAVEEVELLCADGSLRSFGPGDGDAFRAARVSLGALGIVTGLTLRAVPAFRLRRIDRPRPLEAVLERLEALPDEHDHFEFFAFGHARQVIQRTFERTDAPPAPRPAWRAYADDVLLGNTVFEGLCRLTRRVPALIPRVNDVIPRLAAKEILDESYRVFASPRAVRFTEMETAVPRAVAGVAVRAALNAAERHPVNFPIEVRFGRGDDALLSMAYERDSCYVAVHAFRGMPWQRYFRDVEDALAELGGRPHWGKRFGRGFAQLAPLYPGWDAFQAVRAELDPDGRFANRYVRRVLGPPA